MNEIDYSRGRVHWDLLWRRPEFDPWADRRGYLPWFPSSDRTSPLPTTPPVLPTSPPVSDEHIRRIVREEIADLLPIDVPDTLPED